MPFRMSIRPTFSSQTVGCTGVPEGCLAYSRPFSCAHDGYL